VPRDPRKLRVFQTADGLVLEVYRVTATFPSDERFGLQSQLRRAAVSTASNIVEGCARRTEREYVHFLGIATGSAAEAQCLLCVARRLGFLEEMETTRLGNRYSELLKGLQKLMSSFACSKA
jgi:four helix bundle protein